MAVDEASEARGPGTMKSSFFPAASISDWKRLRKLGDEQ